MRYVCFCLMMVFANMSYSLHLRPDSPTRYVVQSGDTLWGIANRYLTDPWEWQALWRTNPNIANPNRLYPGAVIILRHEQDKPYLKVLSNGTVKLSPSSRPSPLDDPIPPIPLSDIKPFLSSSIVLDKDSLAVAPFILAFNTEHLLGGQGDEVYVKNLCHKVCVPGGPCGTSQIPTVLIPGAACPILKELPPGVTYSYAIYRAGGQYIDPETNQCLGYKSILVGYAELLKGGDPATILLTDIVEGVRLGDKVLPNNYPDFPFDFEPKVPSVPVKGHIIDIAGDYTQGAVGLVVVINRGKDVGVQPGDVLAVYKKGKCLPKCCSQFPNERLGEVMVFRTFSQTSFALVVRSIRSIELLNEVINP